jgi:hypothetical protein
LRLRARNAADALISLADVFTTSVPVLTGELRDAVADVAEVLVDRDGALIAALAARLGPPRQPASVYYFHGTRLIEPSDVWTRGLLPHDRVLDSLWDQLGSLAAPEVSATDWSRLRKDMDEGFCGPHTYRRPAIELGPFGLLIRQVFLEPQRWSSWDYLKAPESVDDICVAAHERFGIDLAERYHHAASPYIVEFMTIEPDSETYRAIASVAWYVEGITRGERSHDALLAFDGRGQRVAPEAITAVDLIGFATEP